MSGWDGTVVHIYVALYVIKHMSAIKLIWCVNDISNCGQASVTISQIIKLSYSLTPDINDGFSDKWLRWDYS